MKVLIATENSLKIEGARRALAEFYQDFEIIPVSVPSGVPNQPANEDVYLGVKNRLNNLVSFAKDNNIDADLYLSLESGLYNFYGNWTNISLAMVRDKNGYESFGTSPAYPIPNKYVDEIMKTDLSQTFKRVFNSNEQGISKLTNGKIHRADLVEQAFIMALTKHINGSVWKD